MIDAYVRVRSVHYHWVISRRAVTRVGGVMVGRMICLIGVGFGHAGISLLARKVVRIGV